MRPRLFSFELAWADATLDAIYPENSALPHGIKSMNPAVTLDAVLAEAPLEQSLGIRIAVWMIALAPLFTIRRFGTIASISEEDRGRVIDRLVSSPNYFVRQLVFALKAIASLLYVQSPSIRARMTMPLRPLGSDLVALRTRKGEAGPTHDGAKVEPRTEAERGKTGGDHEHAA